MQSRQIDIASVLAASLVCFWLTIIFSFYGKPAGFVVDRDGKPVASDYVGIYTAGRLAHAGEPAAAYDQARHKAVQEHLQGRQGADFYPWPYPPTFLAVAAAFALLPFAPSMLAWIGAMLALFAVTLARISLTWRDFLLMLATPALWLNLYVGQNGALSAALIGLGLIALPARPLLAGLLIGLLSYKPHLGLLFPVALIAGGHARALLTTAATVLLLGLASLLLFGADPWLAWPEQVRSISAVIGGSWKFEKIQTVYGLGRALGLGPQPALGVHVATVLALAALTAWVWRRPDISYDLKAALLAAGAALTSPYQFVYDLAILTVAQAFLLRYLAPRGIGLPIAAGLVLANILVFAFSRAGLPLGVLGSALVLGLVLGCIRADRQRSAYEPPPAGAPA